MLNFLFCFVSASDGAVDSGRNYIKCNSMCVDVRGEKVEERAVLNEHNARKDNREPNVCNKSVDDVHFRKMNETS